MNSKQWFLTGFSLRRKLFKKSFIIANVLFLLLISLISNLDSIVGLFGGDFEKPYTIYYEDAFDNSYEELFSQVITTSQEQLSNELTLKTGSYDLSDGVEEVVVVRIDENIEGTISSNFAIPNMVYSTIVNGLNSVKLYIEADALGLTLEEAMSLSSWIPIHREILEEEQRSEEEVAIDSGITVLIALPLFIGLITVIQMIGLEIFDEKSTKSMEVLMSNVDPKTHLKSKMWAANLFAVIQFGLILLYASVGIGSRDAITKMAGIETSFELSNYLNISSTTLLIIIVLFILTNMLYSTIMAVLASTANEVDDFQKIQFPMMITMLLGFYAAVFSQILQGAIFIKVMAFIPFFSLLLAPTLYVAGDLQLWHIGFIVAIQLITVELVFRFGVKIYKQAVLDYSNDNVFKRLFNNIKKAKQN